MKKEKKQPQATFIAFAILAITIIFAFACCKHHDDEEITSLTQKEIQITENINGVIIEGPWEVSIAQDDNNNSAKIEYNVKERRIRAEMRSGGILFIKATGSFGIRTILRANIKAELLEKIDASGASNISTYGHFKSYSDVSLSGASELDGFWCEGKEVNLTISGASTVKDFRFFGKDFKADMSGASKLDLKEVEAENFRVDASGASKFTGNGFAAEAIFIASGASDLKAFSLEMDNLNVTLSGASYGEVTVNHTIKGHLSGASTLKYKRAENVQVDVYGASKLIRVE